MMSYIDPRSFVTMEQILAILDYIRDNPQLVHSSQYSLSQWHWAACADLANNVSPDCAQKTPEQWRACFSDIKSKLKRKLKDIKTEIHNFGGGPAKKRLSEVEKRFFPILGLELGDPRVYNTSVSVYDYFDKYTFSCDMYDEHSNSVVPLVLYFYPYDNSCQIINSRKGKNMLRRVHAPFLKKEMLQIGNIVNIFSKLLLITDCAPATMRTLFAHSESTFALIKPVPASMHGQIITFILKKGFRIVRMKNAKIDKDFALSCYSHMAGSNLLPTIIDYVTSGEVIGLELVAPDAVKKWRASLGATDPADAAPGTLRREYGENKLRNIGHGVNSRREATNMLELFFGDINGKPRIPSRATCKDCTSCVILPHAVIDGNIGFIIDHITTSGKFYVSAMAMFSMTLLNAKEFYEVYDQVLPTYEAMCIQMTEGKCIALEVKCKDPTENVVCEFRKLCGPRDPDLCRQLYPDCIRALYGKTIVQNAVHCTDLPEDGELEVEYFFKLVVFDRAK